MLFKHAETRPAAVVEDPALKARFPIGPTLSAADHTALTAIIENSMTASALSEMMNER